MWYLVTALLVFTVYGSHGCVMMSPDQKVVIGTGVYLMCNFSKCPQPLDTNSLSVEWEFQDISSKNKIIIYYIGNQTVSILPDVLFLGNVKLGSFDILLHSVTYENNGTYLCRLRLDGIFYKNHTHLLIHSGSQRTIKNTAVNRAEVYFLWWVPLVSVAGLVLLVVPVFLWRKACRSQQKEDVSAQKLKEVQTGTDTNDMGNIYKVRFSSMPILGDMCTPPTTPNADSIYVTMRGFPFMPNDPVKAGLNRRLPSDWQGEDVEPVSGH
ncbi:uncharacterized protein LOC127630286 isoform X2 [Xyrauchen texanus]|uniref:uncharacterized protein LOC127630286 isoform X2 n=1 Tax=Xyrauchen texanus TaxID=154827 RepID=UPI0022421DD4|nr:uncharacterized protein LOC127630286 isoform X2 [Xyrauchen texanus]